MRNRIPSIPPFPCSWLNSGAKADLRKAFLASSKKGLLSPGLLAQISDAKAQKSAPSRRYLFSPRIKLKSHRGIPRLKGVSQSRATPQNRLPFNYSFIQLRIREHSDRRQVLIPRSTYSFHIWRFLNTLRPRGPQSFKEFNG